MNDGTEAGGVWEDGELRLQNFSQSERLSLRGLLCYMMAQLKIC